jgi:hypothetical protein
MKFKPYSEKLKDPRWQKKRLELLEAADWKCQDCQEKTKTIHVHHGYYARGKMPWEYEDYTYRVLCEECHEIAQSQMEHAHLVLATHPRLLGSISIAAGCSSDESTATALINLCDSIKACSIDAFERGFNHGKK